MFLGNKMKEENMKPENKRTIHRVISTFGERNQKMQALEELMELQSALFENIHRETDNRENIVEEVNETYNTVFNAYDLGKIISVESSALITSIALLEDILEEFLKRGASEIRFIKA